MIIVALAQDGRDAVPGQSVDANFDKQETIGYELFLDLSFFLYSMLQNFRVWFLWVKKK